ncbi:hypothetical protein C8R47DRAFT_1153238 [Mycena vitilis]|nr:hypothetical protein C8R47DRAFT_1153238 [Mycena vitilis]
MTEMWLSLLLSMGFLNGQQKTTETWSLRIIQGRLSVKTLSLTATALYVTCVSWISGKSPRRRCADFKMSKFSRRVHASLQLKENHRFQDEYLRPRTRKLTASSRLKENRRT